MDTTNIRVKQTEATGNASTEELRQRLDNANRHFRRKAAAVLGDEDAVRLLAELYSHSTWISKSSTHANRASRSQS